MILFQYHVCINYFLYALHCMHGIYIGLLRWTQKLNNCSACNLIALFDKYYVLKHILLLFYINAQQINLPEH